MTYIDIVFSGPPSEPATFVEVENPAGQSISVGEWLQRPDGYWVLRIPQSSVTTTSESTDLDALIAEARERGYGDVPRVSSLIDALESTAAELREAEGREAVYRIERDHFSQAAEDIKAELRQERERADEAEHLADVRRKTIVTYMRENADWVLRAHTAERALSRAEETIDRIRGLRFRLSDSAELDAILTEYSEQKSTPVDPDNQG